MQKQKQPYISELRKYWFMKGYNSGDIRGFCILSRYKVNGGSTTNWVLPNKLLKNVYFLTIIHKYYII